MVLGLLWCNIGFAEVLDIRCKDDPIKLRYLIDTSKKTVKAYWTEENKQEQFELYDLLEIDSVKAIYQGTGENKKFKWQFNYGGDGLEFRFEPEYEELVYCKIEIASKPKEKKVESGTGLEEKKQPKDLSNYLIKNKLYLKKTHKFTDKRRKLDLEDQKTLVFTFNLNKKGKLFHLEDKSEMIFVWDIVTSNSFNFKHPESSYSPNEVILDFENNLAQDVIKAGRLGFSYEIITVSDADIKKAEDDKIKEEKLLEEYNLVLDKEYADKKGSKILKKLLWEMRKCAHDVGKLEFKVNKNSGVSRDIGNWINRAENAIDSNNTREMRVTHGNLRRLAHEAFSSVATSYGVDNSTARFCKSLDTNYKFKHSIKFTEWKIKK